MNVTTFFHALFGSGTLALLILAASVGAYLYFSLKVELRLLIRRTATRTELDSRCSELVAELEALRNRLAAAEVRPAPSAWMPQSVNLNQRGQILRLHGKGRTPAEIAADLQISRGEVDLLVKVHDWSTPAVL